MCGYMCVHPRGRDFQKELGAARITHSKGGRGELQGRPGLHSSHAGTHTGIPAHRLLSMQVSSPTTGSDSGLRCR